MTNNDHNDYLRCFGWMIQKQGGSRGVRETREQFLLRVVMTALFTVFPDEA